ncbi:MAG TPA: GNAT family N-acetyltransferase [Baekduia sp.]|nr:GNAT family N-acetyltransferase [Baekduia sp.]
MRATTGARHVRHADPAADGAACAAIYAPSVQDGVASFEAVPPGPEEMAERIASAAAQHAFLVCEDAGGRVAGFASAVPHRQRAAYRWSVDVAIYVGAGDRREGTGRALYEALFGLLRRQGLRWACAGITLPNEASVGLHEALGFQPVGIYREIGFKHGAWRDVGWWQLELTPAGDGPPAEVRGPQTL